MSENEPKDTLPTTVDDLNAEDRSMHDALERAYQEDPNSIPQKFHGADNPVLEYMRSYKGIGTISTST